MNETKNSRSRFLLSLAPMAGYTDTAFRVLCQYYGADETVTEMVSARALYHGDQKSLRLMQTDPAETGVTVQIFGSEPEILADVVKTVLNDRTDFSCIDINMGCPVPKIVKNREGAALLRDPDAAARLAEAVVRVSRKPVSVKIRTGWDHHTKNYVEVGKKLEAAGVSRITLHGRTRSQFYTGLADWDAIGELADALRIPVIGNGDITDGETALRRINETKIQGLAIGRGAVGKPWLFSDIKKALQGEPAEHMPPEKQIAVALRHLQRCVENKGEALAVLQMRKQLLSYVKGWHGASALKQAILAETDVAGIKRVFARYLQAKADRE